MLVSLYIENIAIIRKLSVDFEDGFTILSGETGAGKSILIDSISLVLGGKAKKEMIGSFDTKSFVKAGFCKLPEYALKLLAEQEILPEEDQIFIERKIAADGRSSAKINGVQVPISFLQQLAPYFINIHGQHDNVLMLRPENHIEFLDRFAGLDLLLKDYRREYEQLRVKRSELQKAQEQRADRQTKMEILSQKIETYERLSPVEGMREKLEEKRKILQNREEISLLMQLLRPDEEHSFHNCVSLAIFHAQRLSGLDERASEIYENLLNIQALSESVLLQGEDMLSDFEDGETLQSVEDKLYTLEQLLRQNGPDEAALIADWARCKEEYQRLLDIDDVIADKKSAYLAGLGCVQQCAAELSQKRSEGAALLKQKIEQELRFLDMNAEFDIQILQNTNAKGGYIYNQRGFDKVEFLLSANKGQTPKALSKIASGGELSRIMLSLTSVFCDQQEVETLIFDEVDTGVSGKTARKIGEKLKAVAAKKQVFCITHLAQIASLGEHHLKISKKEHNSVVETSIEPLDFEGRVAEVSRLIGGIHITPTIRKTAEEMLSEAR